MTSQSSTFAAIVRRGWQVLWVRGLGRLLALLLVAPIRVYQWTLSPLLGPTCKYHPSCSRYAVGALQVHGPGKGLLLGGWRLMRCNPWSQGGLDPVPERGHWRPPIHTDGSPRTGGADVPPDDTASATPDRGATMHAVGPTPTSPGA